MTEAEQQVRAALRSMELVGVYVTDHLVDALTGVVLDCRRAEVRRVQHRVARRRGKRVR